MGATRGYVFVWREQGFQPAEIRSALRKVLWSVEHGRQQIYAARKALMRELVQSAGLPGEMLWQPFLRTSEPEAWACRRSGSRWLAVNDNVTEDGLEQPEEALETAEQYARAFGAPALVCSVFDSDFSILAYVHPWMHFRAYRLGGRPIGYCEPCTREQRQLPEFLCPFLTDGGEKRLEELWLQRYDCEEDRIADLAGLLGACLYDREAGRLPEDAEILSIRQEELERTGQKPDEER